MVVVVVVVVVVVYFLNMWTYPFCSNGRSVAPSKIKIEGKGTECCVAA
jgi:hypothetical protein